MMIQECLTEYGHSVVGPIGRAAEALAAAREREYDAAILDINLGDVMAYPVADILSARGVPIVFITGYEADTVEERFSHVPVLQKPVERHALEQLFVPAKSPATTSVALAGSYHCAKNACTSATLAASRSSCEPMTGWW